ncbi:MAG TPA: response regulator [Feifaniaceae bacterium]|nr:response regulator [Feifaniaceae bacterium]
MWKVALIDDEEIIVEGLRRIVPWERYGCEVVAAAYNAAEGERAIRTYAPHIVVTDIKMPDADGLTMLAGLKSEFPDMQVIVLSGHSDFAYAQQAIFLGVRRFLLKPSKMEEIEEALLCATTYLSGKGGDAGQEEAAEQALLGAGSYVVRQAASYMEEHFAERLTLQTVAEHCYVSQWHLSKLLNKHAGQSFYDLLNAIRIGRARELLKDPSLKISEICERTGYADTAHFARVFKRITGMSANEYRNTVCCFKARPQQ